jgi:hypothetical protein
MIPSLRLSSLENAAQAKPFKKTPVIFLPVKFVVILGYPSFLSLVGTPRFRLYNGGNASGYEG